MDSKTETTGPSSTCVRCRKAPASIYGRNESTCESCFKSYILNKLVKRLGAVRREILGPAASPGTLRFLVGLSGGASSAALVHMMAQNREYLLSNPKSMKMPLPFDAVVVHIDTDLTVRPADEKSPSAVLMDQYAELFPGISFRCVPISSVLSLDTIDWDGIFPFAGDTKTDDPNLRLQALFDGLPSLTSRADVLRILIRHLVLAEAVKNECVALLLGCSTTALAEMTISEVAKGRGLSVPWQVNDGPYPLPQGKASNEGGEETNGNERRSIHLYYPLREVYRKELNTYLGLSSPSIADLIVDRGPGAKEAVVSHKDLTIEEAVSRFFESAEEGYPAVVANVVKTTGKLDRAENTEVCSLCGLTADELGDERWKGEIGQDEGSQPTGWDGPLCHGCQRSIRG